MANLPVDFEAKAKMPPAPDGSGYPSRISARDLMDNFRFAALEADPAQVSGLSLEITAEGKFRKIKLAGAVDLSSLQTPAPPGDGTGGTIVGIPTPPSAGTYVLGSVAGVLTWLETTECA